MEKYSISEQKKGQEVNKEQIRSDKKDRTVIESNFFPFSNLLVIQQQYIEIQSRERSEDEKEFEDRKANETNEKLLKGIFLIYLLNFYL